MFKILWKIIFNKRFYVNEKYFEMLPFEKLSLKQTCLFIVHCMS